MTRKASTAITRNDQHHPENRDSQIYLPVDSALQCIMVENLPQLEGKEKERGVVADRRDVVSIGRARRQRDRCCAIRCGKGIVLRLRMEDRAGSRLDIQQDVRATACSSSGSESACSW